MAGTLLCYFAFHLAQFLYRDATSPLRHVAGPASPSWIFGNFKQFTRSLCSVLPRSRRWTYGRQVPELYTADLKALNHIVANSAVYQKPPPSRKSNRRLMGNGIFVVEMDDHKRQNPAFSSSQIRLLNEVFLEKSLLLRDMLAARAQAGSDGEARVEILSWLRRMTLDVIGQAGAPIFFNSLDKSDSDAPDPLGRAFTELFHSPHANRYAAFRMAQSIVPILEIFPMPGWTVRRNARNAMHTIGSQILARSRARFKEDGGKDLDGRRDLLSVLIKANMSVDIPESQRLSDAEVIAQIPTFFIAGHETTSSAAVWALHALSHDIPVQDKLRAELLGIATDTPTMDALNALPYLEWVVRETMRVHSPIMQLRRMAMADDVLPLAQPYIDTHGTAHMSLPIPKGQVIHIPVLAINTDKDIWGADADEFRPERWARVPDATSAIPTAWANLMTFFAGPHHCLGFRFSIVELKVLLFTLIRAFEVRPAVPRASIKPYVTGLVQRPMVVGPVHKGSGLPLIIRPYKVETA
ncbi:cytochrome P450 [Mycena pura]|uniref:Cytochrome P450 n=1 Tax=Mycena pura TaxID=153505 RepID=A0AAD6YJF3_9AGAR|nr:cytochrome P450 [Mycena pura]